MLALSANCREVGLVTIATLVGHIELGEGSTIFRNMIRDLIGNNRFKVILNLNGVSGVDSAGIAELIGAYVPLKTRGGSLKLLKPTKKILAMLELTQLSKVFDVYFDEDAAVNSFGDRQLFVR